MDEGEVLALFDTCSNVGRWGPDDELGTLNLITSQVCLTATGSIRSGRVVSLGLDLTVSGSRQDPPSARLAARYNPLSALDTLALSIHGFEATHVDALGHSFFEDHAWGGRSASAISEKGGLSFASIQPLGARGIVTRGVLLNVAAVQGVPFLEAGQGIRAADLDAAERAAGVHVTAGDAVFIRSGHGLRAARDGDDHDEAAAHEGVLPDVLPWLRSRDVAVYSGDCIERRPSGYARVPMPLHQIGLVAMGLCIIDCPDVEALAAACREEGRAHFMLVVAPLRIPGGTGSAVNPLAIF